MTKHNKYFRYFALFFTLVCLIVLASSCIKNKIPDNILLSSKEIVMEYAKITVFPTHFSLKKPLEFDIEVESFQNPEMLELDLKDTALLEDSNGTLYLPTKWKIFKKSQYAITGRLIFDVLPEATKVITLKLLQDNESIFIWKLP